MAEHKQPAPVKTAEPEIQWMDRLSDMFTRFRRFGWDAVGVLLITLALLTVLVLTGLTGGSWMKAWGGFWLRWMGWGAYLLVLLFLWSGARVLRRSSRAANERTFSLGRILAWECAFFSLLALLSTLGGDSLTRADLGLDGGRIGWGISAILANQLPIAVRAVIFGVIFLIFIALGLNLPGRVNRWADHILGENAIPEPLPPEPPHEEEIENQPANRSERKPAKKPAPLPEEFRKSFKVEPREEEQPLAPKSRDPRLPPLNLLIGEQTARPDERHINLTAGLIEKTLSEFGVPARVVGFRIGPTVTQFAVEPGFIEKPGADGEMMHQKVRV
ncbi:MAG: DNA translocase FtsK, partial [Anaerolineaceae bacterium]